MDRKGMVRREEGEKVGREGLYRLRTGTVGDIQTPWQFSKMFGHVP
jgi:hypothetical protein